MARVPTLLLACLISLSASYYCALAPVPATATEVLVSQSSKPSLRVERLGEATGFLTVTFTAGNLFSPRIVESLSRGLPATLEYEIQFWKKRSAWFDKLVAVNRLSYRVVYDPWEDGFRIVTKEGSSQAVFDIDHVERSLCFSVTGRVADLAFVDSLATYFVAIRATLRPLSAEDIDDVETWLNDGSENGGRGVRAIPGYLFDVIVGLSGLGDQAVTGRSGFFRVEGNKVLPGN
jgi:hypothetical protein